MIIVAIGGSYFFGYKSRDNEVATSKDRLDRAFRHWDSKTGGTTLIEGAGSYNLKTFDSGKNWYAIKYNDEWGMEIIGKAEDVYPGLLSHLTGMDALSSFENIK
jgi:hypothetical protein